MNTLHSTFLRRALLGAVLAFCLPVAAHAAGVELRTDAFQDVVVKGANGKPERKRQTVTNAVPGTEIIYVVSYRNGGQRPAEKVVVNNPVPQGLAYVAGSAQGSGARAEVSVDGGVQFGRLEALRVKDAKGNARAAKAEDVTHLRWTLAAPVAAGQGGSVTYRAIVK